MKILHVIEDLGCGGAEYLLVTLLPELKRNGVECHVAVLWPTYELVAPLQAAGVVVHKLECKHRWGLLAGVFKLSRLAYAQRYDVIHAHLFFSALYVGLSRFFVPQARRVVTFHNLGYDSHPVTTLRQRARWYIDRACSHYLMDARIAVSKAVKKHYERHLHLNDIQVINNCIRLPERIDHARARRTLLQRCALGPGHFIILMPGRLVTEKGHRYALEALCLLRKEKIAPVLVLVGDGPLREMIQAQIHASGLSGQVIMCGALDQTELYEMIAGADMVLMASTHEGWPLVAAEATGLGRPLVATNVGGLPEIIVDGLSGIIVRPADAMAIATAIKQLLADPALRHSLGMQGRQRVLAKFMVDARAGEWCNYYRTLLSGIKKQK